jgi:hypothetical protein
MRIRRAWRWGLRARRFWRACEEQGRSSRVLRLSNPGYGPGPRCEGDEGRVMLRVAPRRSLRERCVTRQAWLVAPALNLRRSPEPSRAVRRSRSGASTGIRSLNTRELRCEEPKAYDACLGRALRRTGGGDPSTFQRVVLAAPSAGFVDVSAASRPAEQADKERLKSSGAIHRREFVAARSVAVRAGDGGACRDGRCSSWVLLAAGAKSKSAGRFPACGAGRRCADTSTKAAGTPISCIETMVVHEASVCRLAADARTPLAARAGAGDFRPLDGRATPEPAVSGAADG